MSPRRSEGVRVYGVELFTFTLLVPMAAATLRVHQNSLKGRVDHSVLLPASYTISDPQGYLRIKWSRAGKRIVEYRCISEQNSNANECNQVLSYSDLYQHRVVLFPENASLLLKHLQINDSGLYQLSVSQARGIERGRFNLTVQADNTNETDHEEITDTDKKKTSGFNDNIRYVTLTLILFFFCFTMKMHRDSKRAQKRSKKRKCFSEWSEESNDKQPHGNIL
ncbi:uncharacterized protein LOC132394534 [Hypanus sabinus]|uniref:uncharacterized protein LOC132394534 n=1 Tax=Hypanus sabinus TaxID=79690 RepID=UPI0028C3D935|nr:uncharacterized protein LOC132394534 [Hypanus sabinus]XP_059826800.1 uncharacterized protein LOC132394534 [Hypanus sabinus]